MKYFVREVMKPGRIVHNYKIVSLIGQGGYGDIYEVEDQDEENRDIHYAMKVEMGTCPSPSLGKEQRIIENLDGSIYFPKIHGKGFETHFRYLVIGLYGKSLSNTRRAMKQRKFSLSTTLRLGVYMMQCIEDFHKNGYVHCDVKPGNFLLQTKEKCPIVLIDFGLSREYIDRKTNQIIPEKVNQDCGFVGTTKYASLNIHKGCMPARRDDIISVCYSLSELIGGHLPWRLTNETDINEAYKQKKKMKLDDVFVDLPIQIQTIYKYAMKLGFTETPNYELIYMLFHQAMEEKGISETDPFDWENMNLKDSILPKAADTVLFPNGVRNDLEVPNLDEQKSGCCLIC